MSPLDEFAAILRTNLPSLRSPLLLQFGTFSVATAAVLIHENQSAPTFWGVTCFLLGGVAFGLREALK